MFHCIIYFDGTRTWKLSLNKKKCYTFFLDNQKTTYENALVWTFFGNPSWNVSWKKRYIYSLIDNCPLFKKKENEKKIMYILIIHFFSLTLKFCITRNLFYISIFYSRSFHLFLWGEARFMRITIVVTHRKKSERWIFFWLCDDDFCFNFFCTELRFIWRDIFFLFFFVWSIVVFAHHLIFLKYDEPQSRWIVRYDIQKRY